MIGDAARDPSRRHHRSPASASSRRGRIPDKQLPQDDDTTARFAAECQSFLRPSSMPCLCAPDSELAAWADNRLVAEPSRGDTSRMMREYQVRICERLGVKVPGPTRQRRVAASIMLAALDEPIVPTSLRGDAHLVQWHEMSGGKLFRPARRDNVVRCLQACVAYLFDYVEQSRE
jgi:hypothetical protein